MESKQSILNKKLEGQPSAMTWCYGTSLGSSIVAVSDWKMGLNFYKYKKEFRTPASVKLDFVCLDLLHKEKDTCAYLACSDHIVRKVDLETRTQLKVGAHTQPLFKIFVSTPSRISTPLIYSLSWDKTLLVWDERDKKSLLSYKKFEGKPYAAACEDNLMAVVTNAREISLFDLLDFHEKGVPMSTDSFISKELPRSLAVSPKGDYIAVGTYAGEILVWSQDPTNKPSQNPIGNGKYSQIAKSEQHFKKIGNSPKLLYPVNDLKFHPRTTGVLVSGGGDGQILAFDFFGESDKIKKVEFPNSNSIPVTNMEFHKSSELLAFCLGEDFESRTVDPILFLQDFRDYLPADEDPDSD